jgi:hypothetical protein
MEYEAERLIIRNCRSEGADGYNDVVWHTPRYNIRSASSLQFIQTARSSLILTDDGIEEGFLLSLATW